MKNLKRILLAVVACAITLQAQAGIREYISQAKVFACNHKGKIVIGVGAALLAGVAYYYMRSKRAHAPVARQSVLRPRNNNVDMQRLHEIVEGVPGANEFLEGCGATLEEIVQGTANPFTHRDMQAANEAHNNAVQSNDKHEMRLAENQPEIEIFIIPNENDTGAGVEFSDEVPSNEDNDDKFGPNLFDDGINVVSTDTSIEVNTHNIQGSVNLGESFTNIPALGELTDSIVMIPTDRDYRHPRNLVAVAVDQVKYTLGQISQQIDNIKNNLNDESEIASAVNAIKTIYNSKQSPIEPTVINPIVAQGVDSVINKIVNKPSDRTYASLVAEYERAVNSLQYVAYQAQ